MSSSAERALIPRDPGFRFQLFEAFAQHAHLGVMIRKRIIHEVDFPQETGQGAGAAHNVALGDGLSQVLVDPIQGAPLIGQGADPGEQIQITVGIKPLTALTTIRKAVRKALRPSANGGSWDSQQAGGFLGCINGHRGRLRAYDQGAYDRNGH